MFLDKKQFPKCPSVVKKIKIGVKNSGVSLRASCVSWALATQAWYASWWAMPLEMAPDVEAQINIFRALLQE